MAIKFCRDQGHGRHGKYAGQWPPVEGTLDLPGRKPGVLFSGHCKGKRGGGSWEVFEELFFVVFFFGGGGERYFCLLILYW